MIEEEEEEEEEGHPSDPSMLCMCIHNLRGDGGHGGDME